MDDINRVKSLAVTILIGFSLTVIFIQIRGGLYPMINLFGFVGVLSAILLTRNSKKNSLFYFYSTIALLSAVSVFYRAYPLILVESTIGIDPNWYILQTFNIIEESSTSAVSSNFYQSAPSFLILNVFATLVTGLPPNESLLVYPLVFGLSIPAAVGAISLRLQYESNMRYHNSILGAAIASIATISVFHSFWPIAQSVAVYIWIMFVLSLSVYVFKKGSLTSRQQIVTIIFLFIISQAFIHKLSLLSMLVTFIGLAISVWYINRIKLGIYTLFPLMFLLLIVQWTWFSSLIFSPINIIVESLNLGIQKSTTNPTAASAPNQEIFGIAGGIIYRGMNLFILSFVAGAALVYKIREELDQLESAFIVFVTIFIGFLGFAPLLAGATNTVFRVYMFVELMLILVLSVALRKLVFNKVGKRSPNFVSNMLFISIIIIVVSSQALAPIGALDHPQQPRRYLTEGELDAKKFAQKYISDHVYSEWFYSQSISISNGANEKQYMSFSGRLENGQILSKEYPYVSFRNEIRIHQTKSGWWKLKWSPIEEYQKESTYHKIYDNDWTVMYKKKQV